jgi:fructokinase
MNTLIPKNKVYCFGEILWDILPDGPQPGGAPLNVAYHLTKLNLDAGLISRTGADAEGEKLEQLLAQWEIDSTFMQTDPARDTG